MRDVLRREYPQLRLAGTTRQAAADAPFNGRRVDVQPLSENQQLELARAIVGVGGADLMERAWRTHGLRNLVGIPFYLTALADNAVLAMISRRGGGRMGGTLGWQSSTR